MRRYKTSNPHHILVYSKHYLLQQRLFSKSDLPDTVDIKYEDSVVEYLMRQVSKFRFFRVQGHLIA